MPTFMVEFKGHTRGSIGKLYPVKTTVEARDRKEVPEKLAEKYDHVTGLKIGAGYLNRNEVRQSNKTYKGEKEWEGYLDIRLLNEQGISGAMPFRKKPVVVKAHSRIEAFDKLRTKEIEYNRTHRKTIVAGRGVAHAPRLSR